MSGFSSAEILIALMLMSAMHNDDDAKNCGGSGAAGFLAGLAIAGQLGQATAGLDLQAMQPAANIASSGGVGMSLNAQA